MRVNPWAVLVIAGIFEIVWAVAMDYSDGFTVWYFDVVVVVTEIYRPGRIDLISLQHLPDAVPLCGGPAHDLNQLPVGNGTVGVSGQVQGDLIRRHLRMAGQDFIDFFISRKLSPYDVKLSILARGISVGDELEYTDEVTLGRSILNRTPFRKE